MSVPGRGLPASRFPFAAALSASYFVVALAGVLRHEMWRDELHAWLLARDSASLIELFANMRLDGHPALWHLVLFVLARASADPLLMQLVHIGIATGSVYLMARFSPFSGIQKCLLAFGYFSLYEYALISRGYALGIVLAFAFCALFSGRERSTATGPLTELAGFVTLALLANTSVHGLFLSAALALYLMWPDPRRARLHGARRRVARGTGLALLLAGWLLSYVQVSRINDGRGGGAHLAQELAASGGHDPMALAARLASTIAKIWRSYVPIPKIGLETPWNSNVLNEADFLFPQIAGQNLARVLALLLSLMLVAWACHRLRGQVRVLTTYLAGTSLLLAFSFLFFEGALRHHGHLFVLLIACLWLAGAQKGERHSALLTLLLTCHVAVGAWFYQLDWRQPFSGSEAAAAFLQERQLADLPILGYRDREASTLSAYLDRPVYYPNVGRFGSFWLSGVNTDWTGISDAISGFVRDNGSPVILALTQPMDRPIANVQLQLLMHAEGLFEPQESFYLYLATTR